MPIVWAGHEIDLPAASEHVGVRATSPRPLADPAATLTERLESPFEYPALRRALTPDDRIALVLDPALSAPATLLPSILRHLSAGRVDPSAVTIVCPRPDQDQSWVDALPDEFQEVRVESHRPDDRKALAYLAATREGRRIYLNRSTVDADQIVVLSRLHYDALVGYAGGATALFPSLSDDATLAAVRTGVSLRLPEAIPLRREAEEVAWLLGAPFFVHAIEDANGAVVDLVAGSHASDAEARRRLDAGWRARFPAPVDLAIATLTGDAQRHTFADVARALFHASRLVQPGGRVALLSAADPELGPAAHLLRESDEPAHAKRRLVDEKPPDLEAGLLWLAAADRAKLFVLSQASSDVVEEMFAVPLDKPQQVRKLLADGATFAVLPDAHLAVGVVEAT